MAFLLYGCDPAHAVGSTDGPDIVTEFRRSYPCPDCRAEFEREVDLGEHLTLEHPILQPHLLVAGTRVPAQWTIRQPVDASAVHVMNATEIWLSIDGGSLRQISPETFRQVLTQTRDGVLELHLRSSRASQRYDVRILVPEDEDLRRVEKEFGAHLARTDVTITDVRHFDEALAVGPGAREYASALADYVYGVLAKDGAGHTSLPFAAFLDKFKRSLAVVSSFERAFAMAVSSCIRFNLNDFRGAWKPSGVRSLDRAFGVFRQRALGRPPAGASRALRRTEPDIPVCPVDTMTQIILDIVNKNEPSVQALRDLTSRQDLSDEDRVKVCVLLVDRSEHLKPAEVAAYRTVLEFDPIFGPWVRQAVLRGQGA